MRSSGMMHSELIASEAIYRSNKTAINAQMLAVAKNSIRLKYARVGTFASCPEMNSRWSSISVKSLLA